MLSETFRNLHVENLRLRETLSCESTKRQLLQKELLDLKGNIRVIVRCRPLLSMDYQNKGDSCTGLKAVEFDPSVNDTLTLFGSVLFSKTLMLFNVTYSAYENTELNTICLVL